MIIRLIALFAFLLSSAVNASDTHYSPASHHLAEHNDVAKRLPREAGQGAFAALAEIVSVLMKDPNTDWTSVDIEGLREHLVDMNQLTLNATVVKRVEKTEVVFIVTGAGGTLRAIQNMVPVHSAQLAQITSWETKVRILPKGVVFTLGSDQKEELKKISALGFFGVMAVGSHHQLHHLQIAKGQNHH